MFLKRFYAKIKRLVTNLQRVDVGMQYKDKAPTPMEGEVFFEIRDGKTNELLEKRHIKNVITKDMSILLAWLAWDNAGPTHGIFGLAVGTGDPAWNLGASDAPPPADAEQRSLFEEIERKGFLAKSFVDGAGDHVAYPTNIVDFTTKFDVGEASDGALVEMGLIGGDVDLNNPNPLSNASPYDPDINVETNDLLCNYITFKPINKPASSTMTISWRITF